MTRGVSVDRKRRATSRFWSALVAVLPIAMSACVYYNGVYNAKSAAKSGDARLRRGDESGASSQFDLSSARAESVLVRFPKSKWRTRALYLAGRGAAYSGQCERALPRLTEFLAEPTAASDDRARARIAMASCDMRGGRLPVARARLDSLIETSDARLAREARVWAARTALAAGDRDGVSRYLVGIDAASLEWDLMTLSMGAGEYSRAESLLVLRANVGDFREDVARAVRDLSIAGQWDAAEHIVASYDHARVRDVSRAMLHYTLGDLGLRSGRDSVARTHLLTARQLAGRDSLTEREAVARLSLMPLSTLSLMRDVDTLFAAQDSAVRLTTYARRSRDQLLLLRMLYDRADATGASRYLAAEVARDSLRARPLARTLFLDLVRERPESPLAPNALYAASVLLPDSAVALRQRIEREYPASAVATWLRGEDPGTRADFITTPEALRFAWQETVRVWSDSVRKLRTTRTVLPAR